MLGPLALLTAFLAGAAAFDVSLNAGSTKKSKFKVATFVENSINYGTDGGLYAELIHNRAFQNNGSIANWDSVGSADLKRSGSSVPALSKALPNSITVSAGSGGGEFGLKNYGYFGIPVKQQTYKVSFYARAAKAASVTAKASLVANTTNQVYASVSIPLKLTSEWQQFEADLVSKATAPNAKNGFQLTFPKGSPEISLNVISVFPPTWKDTKTRADLAQPVANIGAPLSRLPGGNEMEGPQIKDAFNWSVAVGPLKDRPGQVSAWTDFDTNGYGLHEALDFIEAAGSEPILDVYAGYSLDKVVVAEADLQPYIQSAVDELHYIKDPQGSSAFAKRREANGRAQPWTLNYVEIGNEDWISSVASNTYKEYRYEAFYKALKAAFPEIKYISSSPYVKNKAALEAIDQHNYDTPDFFFNHSLAIDSWPRNNTEILELEFACINSGLCGEGGSTDLYGNACRLKTPTLIGALSEAAFMAGMERNGDVFSSAAYAPLFQNNAAYQWGPDLVTFNWETVVLSASYWVQYLFAQNRIDSIITPSSSASPDRTVFVSAGLAAGDLVVKVVNRANKAQSASIKLSGGATVGGTEAPLWTLAGKDPQQTNTVDNPESIKPSSGNLPVKEGASSFDIALPPYSFQVVRIPLKTGAKRGLAFRRED